ncbi:MAG: hypothetical protein ACI31P_00360 [Ligilactobacillus ruminis]
MRPRHTSIIVTRPC